MWNFIKDWFRGSRPETNTSTDDFKWHDPGEGNPFGVRVLDIRSLTWTLISITQDPRIAVSYVKQRNNDGREFANVPIEDSGFIDCHIAIPFEQVLTEGVLYKSPQMEYKWDIYFYNSSLLFVRSWSGILNYRAEVEVKNDHLIIRRIEANRESLGAAPDTVKFLFVTHVIGKMMPHCVSGMEPLEEKTIAMISFGLFGRMACFATFEDIMNVPFTDISQNM